MTLVSFSVAPAVYARNRRGAWLALRWRGGRVWIVAGRWAWGVGR
jgi:hypothetical protein